MTGSGTAGLLWTMRGESAYFFLDLLGGARPYLLASIDNGVGQLTPRIQHVRAGGRPGRGLGRPWRTRLPVVLPVVARSTRPTPRPAVTSRTFRYSEGRYDGALREFAGFGAVAEKQIGDATAPTC